MDQLGGSSDSSTSSSSSEGFSSSSSLSSSSSSSDSSSSSSSGRSSSSTTSSGSSSSSSEGIGTSVAGGAGNGNGNGAWDDKAGNDGTGGGGGGNNGKRKEDAAANGGHRLRNDKIVFDVFISDPFCPDIDLFRLWVNGTQEKAVPCDYKATGSSGGDLCGSSSDADGPIMSLSSGLTSNKEPSFIRAHIRHQYHLFRLVAEKLQRPNSLKSRIEINIARKDQSDLIKLYYAFDDCFVRQLVGKKISANVRKALDGIAETVQVPFSSCLRQFDNIKRVYKFAVEPYSGSTPLVTRICDEFRLHTKTATRYAVTSFIAQYRPTFEKKLQGCPYKTVEQLTLATIKAWTNGVSIAISFSVAAMREAKKHIKKVDAKYCEDVRRRLGSDAPRTLTDEKPFKAIVKSVGMLLDDTSELTSFENFYEVVLKFCEAHFWGVCSHKDQLTAFFDALVNCAPEFIKADEGTAWKAYLTGIRDLCVIFYDLLKKRS